VTHVGAIFSNLPASSFSERMIEHAAVSGCGWHFTDSIPVGATQTTFNAELSKMQSDGVKVIFEIGTTQDRIAEMKREADQQGWKPIFISPVAYASNFVELVGSAQEAEGVVGSNLYSLFFSPDDAHNIPEVALYQQWMHLTHPDAPEDLYSMYSWASAKLFVQELRAVGPTLTRKAFLDAIRTVHSYDAAGLLTQSDIGGHKPGTCYVMWRIHNGQYARYNTPAAQYRCDGEFVPYTGS
jgi:ABC-type branched-subunit amino acid transport system substrate-binding protein